MNTDTYKKYLAADRLAASSHLIAKWLVESLESQDAKGNLTNMDQVNLKMGRDLVENLQSYLRGEEVK